MLSADWTTAYFFVLDLIVSMVASNTTFKDIVKFT